MIGKVYFNKYNDILTNKNPYLFNKKAPEFIFRRKKKILVTQKITEQDLHWIKYNSVRLYRQH